MTVLKEAQISRKALQHNLDYFYQKAPNKKILACVKANGYGHGFYEIMPVLSQADGCYVHSWDAAIRLRRDWPELKIVLAGFPGSATLLEHLTEEQIDWVIYDDAQLALLSQLQRQHKSIVVWLKIDTGLHRLGFPPSDIARVMQVLDDSPLVRDVVFMTHLACADDVSAQQNSTQAAIFREALQPYQYHYTSLGNTAVALNEQMSSGDWQRIGIGLYGISPFKDKIGRDFNLQPVMNFCARVISIRRCEPGHAVGYGALWSSERHSQLAVIAVGYGDGYPRGMPNGTPVKINEQLYPLVGRVSMDTIVVDLGPSHNVAVGDWAQLWGDELPVEQIAEYAGTIPYELVTRVGRRVRRCIRD